MSGKGKGSYLPGRGLGPSGSKRSFAPNLAAAGKRQTPTPTPDTDSTDSKNHIVDKKKKRGEFQKKDRNQFAVETDGLFSAGVLNKAKASEASGLGGSGGGGSGGPKSYRRVRIDDDECDGSGGRKASTNLNLDDDDYYGTDESALKDLLHDDKFIAGIRESESRPLNVSVPDQKRDIAINKPLAGLKLESSPKKQSETKEGLLQLLDSADNNELGEMVLIQFPNALSKMVNKSDGTDANMSHQSLQISVDGEATETPAETSGKSGETQPSSIRHSLDALPEGKVGKLQIFQSGKARMLLGNLVLDVELGSEAKFRQELASITLDENAGDDKTGEMKVLGRVKHRITCLPDINNLFPHDDT